MFYFNPMCAIYSTDMKFNIEYSLSYLGKNLFLSYEVSYVLIS